MVEVNPNNKIEGDIDDGSDVEELEAQLNEIEHALDNLESQNDTIHSKLKELLESNREIRKEMASLGFSNKKDSIGEQKPNQIKSDVSHLQQIHSLAHNSASSNSENKQNKSETSPKSKKN